MATFRSGVKILGHISRTKGHGGVPFRSRSCDRRTLLNIQVRQESAFVVQDSCEDSLKETRRSRSWLSIFSRHRSPDSITEDERVLKKEDESWFSYFSKKPLQVKEKKITSNAINKDKKHILRNNTEEDGNRIVYNDIIKENASSSISKRAVCHLHKSANIMSPRSTVGQPLSREITLAYGRSGFHSIPPNSYTKDKITILKKHAASTQQSTDVNYSSMVTQNPEASMSLPYTGSDVQNLLMISISKSSSGCANPHLFVSNEMKRSNHKGTSQEKSHIIDFGSQNLQLHSSTCKLKNSKINDIGTIKQKGNIKQQLGHKLQSQSSLPNAYADKVDHKVLYSESSSTVSVNNERQKREREAFLKTKALISMKPIASTQNSKTPSGKQGLQSNSYSVNDQLKCTPLKLNIKPKGKVLDQFTNLYISEVKPKTQKSKYISDSPLIKQKSHPTQFVVHPSMIAKSSIPLRLSSSTANTSEKYPSVFEESKIYQNELKGPITTFSSLIDKIDTTAERSHMAQNLRNKQAVAKKPDMDNILRHESLAQQEEFTGMTQATKTENDDLANTSCEHQANSESYSTWETTNEVNSKIIMEQNYTKQNDNSKTVSADCSQEPNDINNADMNTNTAEEIMLEKKHKYHDDLNENMRSKFGMHMPYFKNQNNILAFKKSKGNKINKNDSLSLNKQIDASKSLLWMASTKPAKDNISEVCEADIDKNHNSETTKVSPRTTPEDEYLQQKTEVLSEISKSLDPKAVTVSDESDKNIGNECVSSNNEMEKSEGASEELPELTLQTEDSVEVHQQVPLEKPTRSLRRHKYFPNYFSKRSHSGYTDPPAFGEKLEISFCPGKEKGSSSDKCKRIGAKEEKSSKKTCTKVVEPGCEPAKHTLCTPPLPTDECVKRMPPAPSYSECIKPPIAPKVYRECNPVKDLECPSHKQQKDYDACNQKPQENVCSGDKKKKQDDDEIHKIDNTCPDTTEYCPEPYKGQKTMGFSGSPMKCLSRNFSNYQFKNALPNRFYSTCYNENPLLRNRNASKVCPNHMITLSSFYHKKVECKSGGKGSKAPSSDKSCKKLGRKDEKKKKQTCVKITQDGCVIPKSTLCVPPTNFEKCNKVLAPKPSYSECMRSVEIPPRPFTECDPTVDLECPQKKRKNYNACHPPKKSDGACPPGGSEKKPTQLKDNTCPKDEECPPPFGGKKANSGYSKVAIKCPSMNNTTAYLPPRRYFSSASGRYILKSYSSPALDSSNLYTEEITYTPFIVAQHMRNDSQQQSSHERNTLKGKPFVTLSASYCSFPIFLDYMAFKSSYKCKNCIALNTNFLPKIAPNSNKVTKVAQCTNSKRLKDKQQAAKRTGIKGMEMERFSKNDIIVKKHRLSGSYVPEAKCLTFSHLLHNTQDMVSERTYSTWSTIKWSTKIAPQKNIVLRQCTCKNKGGKSDSLNEPCTFHSEKEVKKTKKNKCSKEAGEKAFSDCHAPNKEKPTRCSPAKKMKVVAPPRKAVKVVTQINDCPKPPQKVQHKCQEELPPPPPPPPPANPPETFIECPKPKPKAKMPCVEEVKEAPVEVSVVCRSMEPAPTFTQCPKPKSKTRRKCEAHETPSEPCKTAKKKPESPPDSTKPTCSGISSQFIISPIVPHSVCAPFNLSWPKVRFYYKLARNYSIKADKTSVMVGKKPGLCFGGFSFWQEITKNYNVQKLQYEKNNPKNASSIANLRSICSKPNVNIVLNFLSNMKPMVRFLKVMECYPELHLKQKFRSVKHAVANSAKKSQTSPFYNQYKYINESRNELTIISPKRTFSKKQKQPPSFSEYMHLKSKSQRYTGKNRASASKMKKQQSLNSMNNSVSKEKKHIPCLKLPILHSLKHITPDISPTANSQSSPILLPPPKSSDSTNTPLPETSSAVTEAESTHSASKAQEKKLSSSPTSSSSCPKIPSSCPPSTEASPIPMPLQQSASKCLAKPVSSSTKQLPAAQIPSPIASSPSRIASPPNSCSSTQQSSLVKATSSRAPSLSKCSPSSLAQGLPPPPPSPPPSPSLPLPPPPRSAVTCSAKSKSLQSSKVPSSLAKKCACLLPDIICKILTKENTLEICREKKKCSEDV